jgi:hypothetical protein
MNAPISLYKLADAYMEASHRLADLDLPDEVIRDTLEGMSGELEVKATNVAMFARNLEATAETIRQAEFDMATRRKAIEARAKRLRVYLQDQMSRTGITKIECPYFKLAIRDNPPAVAIDAEGQIPQEFMRTPEPPPPAPDKKAIAEALKAGKDVPGAHLERGQRLEIK